MLNLLLLFPKLHKINSWFWANVIDPKEHRFDALEGETPF
jgi:hypothetical protein